MCLRSSSTWTAQIFIKSTYKRIINICKFKTKTIKMCPSIGKKSKRPSSLERIMTLRIESVTMGKSHKVTAYGYTNLVTQIQNIHPEEYKNIGKL